MRMATSCKVYRRLHPRHPHMELALANDPNITIITCKNERNQLKKKKYTKKKDVYAQSSHMLLQDEDNELHRD